MHICAEYFLFLDNYAVVNIMIAYCCVICVFFFLVLWSYCATKVLHLHIIMRYDRIWYRYCFERFSWYANMILIYDIHVLHLAKTLCQYALLFQYFGILRSICVYIRKKNEKNENNHLHSLQSFEYIVCVSMVECIFVLNTTSLPCAICKYSQSIYYILKRKKKKEDSTKLILLKQLLIRLDCITFY